MKALLPAVLAGCAFASLSHAQDNKEIAAPEVVVTATRFEDTYADKPVSVTVITSDDIQRSPARTLPDLLSSYVGIGGRDLFGNNGALATVDMRGFGATGAQNTLVLIDGRRQNDIDISGVQWSAIPIDFVERIEIVRGSGAVLYGDSAVAGVINIITRKPGIDGSRASATIGAGSFETYSTRVDGELSGTNVGLRVGGSYFDSHGYRDNNENTQSAAFADARWTLDRNELSLRFSGAKQDLRLPGGRQVQPSIGENELESDRRGADTPLDYANRDDSSLQFDWTRSGDVATTIVGVSYRTKDQTSYFDQGGFPDYREVDLDVLSITPRLRIDHSQAVFLPGSLVVGFDWYKWDYHLNQTSSPGTINQPVHRVTAEQENRALYATETFKPFASTTITAGARIEWFSIDAKDVFDPTAPNPSFLPGGSSQGTQDERQDAWELGLRQGLNDQWSFYGRAGSAYRFATVDEIYEGSAAFNREIQFLRPQTSKTYEGGVDWRHGTTMVRAGVFVTDVKDEIHLDAFTSGVGNTNLPPSRRKGFELEAGVQPLPVLALRFAYTYTDAKFLEGTFAGGPFTPTNVSIAGKTVPLVARHRANIQAGLKISEHLHLDLTSAYVSSQYMENDEENDLGTKIPEYIVTDMRLAYETPRYSVGLTVLNLFDEEYYNYAVRSQFNGLLDRYSAYPLPGRSTFLELKVKFGL